MYDNLFRIIINHFGAKRSDNERSDNERSDNERSDNERSDNERSDKNIFECNELFFIHTYYVQ